MAMARAPNRQTNKRKYIFLFINVGSVEDEADCKAGTAIPQDRFNMP